MQISKEHILELLRSRGEDDKAREAEAQLPDQVDSGQDAGTLERLGIDPKDLLNELPGGLGGKLGL
jgi:hypothetical protein